MSEIQSIEHVVEKLVEYRDVVGFPGYRVGDDGSVWSLRNHNTHWKRMVGGISSNGRRQVTLCIGSLQKNRNPYRLVLEAFVGPCPPGMEACHNDGNVLNERLSNLRWGTPKSNQADRVKHGTDSRGEKCKTAKLNNVKVTYIRSQYATGTRTLESLAIQLGVTMSCIHSVIKRRTWAYAPING